MSSDINNTLGNPVCKQLLTRISEVIEGKIDKYKFTKILQDYGEFICNYEGRNDVQLNLIFSPENMKELAEKLYNNQISAQWKTIVFDFFDQKCFSNNFHTNTFNSEKEQLWLMILLIMANRYPNAYNQFSLLQEIEKLITSVNDLSQKITDFLKNYPNLIKDNTSNLNQKEYWKSWQYDYFEVEQELLNNRNKEIQEVRDILNNNPCIVLRGVPGIGKTILAKSIIAGHDKTVWLDYQKSLRDTILTLAKTLNIDEKVKKLSDEQKYAKICDELCKYPNDDTYMVIDNCNGLQKFDQLEEKQNFVYEFGDFYKKVICHSKIKFIFTTIFNENISPVTYTVGAIKEYIDFFKKQLNVKENNFDELLEKIGKQIDYNTYITVLLANLISRDIFTNVEKKLQDMLAQIEQSHLADETEEVNDPYAKIEGLYTIMQHVKKMYFFDVFNNVNETYSSLLYILSLVPQQGISLKLLEKLYPIEDLKKILSELHKYSWISVDKGKITVHSLVRELFINAQDNDINQSIEYCSNLLNNAENRKEIDIYQCFELEPFMHEVYRIIMPKTQRESSKLEWIIVGLGYLLTEIYEETLTYYDRVYSIATEILGILIPYTSPNVDIQIKRVRMISGCAYSQLHTNTEKRQKKLEECEIAKKNLDMALKEINKIIVAQGTKWYYEKTLATAFIHGNLGAYYRNIGKLNNDAVSYKCAIEEHTEGLKIRRSLLKDYKKKRDKLMVYIATSIYCLGLDYRSLQNYSHSIKYLKGSLLIRENTTSRDDKYIQSATEIWRTLLEIREDDVADIINNEMEVYTNALIVAQNFYLNNRNRKGLNAMKDIINGIRNNKKLQQLIGDEMSEKIYNNAQKIEDIIKLSERI